MKATLYCLDRLRCNGCGQIFTAPQPEGVGAEKYDETAAAMVAQLKYGSGMPFARMERLEQRWGVPGGCRCRLRRSGRWWRKWRTC